MACYRVHQTAMRGEDLGTGMQPCTTQARYPVHRVGKERRRRCGCRASQLPSTVQDADLIVAQLPASAGKPGDHSWLF